MDTKTYLDELKSKPCECIVCDTCNGHGWIDDPFDYADLSQETCPDCLGDAIDVCERCHEIEEIEHEQDFVLQQQETPCSTRN